MPLRSSIRSRPALSSRLTNSVNANNEKTAYPNLGMVSIMVNWGMWETADNVWSSSIESTLRTSLLDAHTRNYSIFLRIVAGSDAPAWLYADATTPVKTIYSLDTIPGVTLLTKPVPDDATYVSKYTRMLQRLAGILNEVNSSGHRNWRRIHAVSVSGPTGSGAEMTVGYQKAVGTVHASTGTVGTAFERGAKTLTLTADPGAGWPGDGTTEFLVRVGASWTDEGAGTNRGNYAWPLVFDDFENRTASAGSVGLSRNGYGYMLVAQNAGNINQLSVAGGAHQAALPASAGAGVIDYSIFHDATAVQDGDFETEFQADALPTTATTAQTWSYSLVCRATTATPQQNHYQIQITRSTTGTTRLSVNRRLAGTNTNNIGPGAINLSPALAVNIPWVIHARLTTVGSDIHIQVKAYRKSDGEPVAWTMDFTDVAPDASFLGAGWVGIRNQTDSANTTAVIQSTNRLIVGSLTAAPFYLKVTRATPSSTVLNVVENDWSGTFTLDVASGLNVHYVDDVNVDMTTIQGKPGPRSLSAWNYGTWELVVPGEMARKDRHRDAWARCIDLHVRTIPWCAASVAAGPIFNDSWQRAEQLAKWAANGSSVLGIVEPGGAAFSGSQPPGKYGYRYEAFTTTVDYQFDWSIGSTDSPVVFYRSVENLGCYVGGQISTATSADGDQLIQATENLLTNIPKLWWVEWKTTRFASAVLNTAATATWGGWSGGSGRTPSQYGIDDPGCLQNRLTGP